MKTKEENQIVIVGK